MNVLVSRGQVHMMTIGKLRKPYLVVSNNARNRALDSFLAVRITTTDKPSLDSIIRLTPEDAPIAGSVLCDDLELVYEEEIDEYLGALPPKTMMKVDDGLRTALALR